MIKVYFFHYVHTHKRLNKFSSVKNTIQWLKLIENVKIKIQSNKYQRINEN